MATAVVHTDHMNARDMIDEAWSTEPVATVVALAECFESSNEFASENSAEMRHAIARLAKALIDSLTESQA